MTFKTFAVTSAAAALAITASSAAAQQQPARPATPAPAAAAPQVTHGAAPAGLCVVSPEGVLANSTVGKYVQTRMQQLAAQVNAELQSEGTAIDNEAKQIDAQRASIDQNTFEQRAAAVQVKANAFARKRQQRENELQLTQQKAINRVGEEMEPLIRQAYQAKGCGMLFNRQVIVLANPTTDITPQVVTALNGKITQFTFDRERLDQQATPGAARPAAAPAR
ncbi:MAG: OmpH family outer membrane protein [Phenylobacterium sp.]|uniref:OmpH family outer membrane protein n=1 Tax=Phenylobacterium sp. TaxID=1871053 RepID=UPI001A4B908B|nr:OmpH family outer membrane protein [Phenylobacterium sp.]MBL8770163.1 OmpH family outer membrane protein [Phenylobacterium sp.]